MEAPRWREGLWTLISDPEVDLSLSCPVRSAGALPAYRAQQPPGAPSLAGFGHSPSPPGKPVLIPSGPRRQSLGVVKLIREGYRRFLVTPSALFNCHLQISGWCLLRCILRQRESELQRALGDFYCPPKNLYLTTIIEGLLCTRYCGRCWS